MQLNGKEKGLLTISLRNGNFDETKVNELKEFELNISDYKDILEEIDYEVAKFLEDKNKLLVNPLLTEEELQPTELVEISNKVVALEERLKEYKAIENEQKELKAMLKEAMEKYNVKKWTTNNGTQITLVADTPDKEVQKFNEEKFAQENLELYEKYIETKVQKGKSGCVKVTL